MNYNVLSNIYSFIKLEELSDIIYNNKNNAELNNNIILHFANKYNTSFDTINYKIHNCQNRCGICQKLFTGDYIVKLG